MILELEGTNEKTQVDNGLVKRALEVGTLKFETLIDYISQSTLNAGESFPLTSSENDGKTETS